MSSKKEELDENNLGRKFYFIPGDVYHEDCIIGETPTSPQKRGPYQVHNLIALRKLIPHARNIIDVGMNIGNNIIEYATFSDKVYGFEPLPYLFDMAKRNVDLNFDHNPKYNWFNEVDPQANMIPKAKIFLYDYCLSNQKGTLTFLDRDEYTNMMSCVKDERIENILPEKDYEEYNVKASTIDNFLFDDVDIIKIDVEGYELPVILGAKETILKTRPVVQVEMHENFPNRYGYELQDILDWFKEKDYDVYLYDGTKLDHFWRHYENEQHLYIDRFFVPREMNVEGFAKNG